MKIVKASNGKNRLTLSKKEWKEIGRTAGWLVCGEDGQKETGVQKLSGGYLFYWEKREDSSGLSGHVVDRDGNPLSDVSGNFIFEYMTNSPEIAAKEIDDKIIIPIMDFAREQEEWRYEMMDNDF